MTWRSGAPDEMKVVRTYLEMDSPGRLVPARPVDSRDLRLERLERCPASFYRFLYLEVGRAYRWRDRAGWPDERIREHLARREVGLWLLSRGGAPAGYFELERHPGDSIEIAYLGLLPEAVGHGLGGWLLTAAVHEAWALGPRRVWLHTCTLDHPAALPNYVARGFRPVREEAYELED